LAAATEPAHTNRLINETSPYLQQHADNPVDWYPWGEEAFAAAREQQKPILLSIGYSTCHWCHVMEEESFDNPEIAAYLNSNYIAIKVDREERPDIDRLYMAAVEAFAGRGGWPMTVWLTPDRQPFFGSTYMPPYDGDRGVQQGFLTHLQSLRRVWDQNPDDVDRASEQLVAAVRSRLVPPGGTDIPDEEVFDQAYRSYRDSYDPEYGGLKTVPKFASHLPIRFLLRYHRRSGDGDALRMAEQSLEAMAAGGLFDQIGGGFHRYSTDASWHIPHFEKMLYDNALLALAYLEAFQLTGNDNFARVSRETLRYAERDMRSPRGVFYAASDADSRSRNGDMAEGWFFTWSATELANALSESDLEVVNAHYQITDSGDLDGRNVLRIATSIDGLTDSPELGRVKDALYQIRSKRPQPFVDTKILTAWNGLMISAFARASLVFADADYLDTASVAGRFILENMQDNGHLLRSWIDDKAAGEAFADDYAFFIQALIDLYQASGDIDWFRHAVRLQAIMNEEFGDSAAGGFFFSATSSKALFAREKPAYDRSIPSANSVAILNLLRFYELTSDDAYRRRAHEAIRYLGEVLTRSPAAAPDLLQALDFYTDEAKAIVLVTAAGREEAEPFLRVLGSTFLPNHVLTVVTQGSELDRHASLVPLLEGKRAMQEKTTAYVCEHGICDLPTSDPAVFATQIGGNAP